MYGEKANEFNVRRQRIAMVVLSLYPNDVRVRRQAEALAEAGHEVDILCMRGAGQLAEEKWQRIRAFRIVRERPKERIGRYLWLSAQFAAAAFFKLQRLDIKSRYDLVQIHNMPDYLVFSALAQRLTGRPVVLDIHDLMVELFHSKWGRRKSAVLLPIVRSCERVSCAFANQVITTSDGFGRRLVDRGVDEGKVTLVLNTADPNIFKLDEHRQYPPIQRGGRLIYHGTIAERYGLTTAIKAMVHVSKSLPECQFEIYGKGDASYISELKALIKRLGLEDNVTLGGWHTLEQINSIITQCDLGIVPHHRDSFMDLALSTKTFEYAQTGLPVVASRVPSLTSIFSDDCICFTQPGDAEDLARGIVDTLRDPAKRKKYARASKSAIVSISWDVMKRRYLDLVDHSIARSGNGKSRSAVPWSILPPK